MGHKKRKNKTPEEPNNKKVAKLNSENDGGNEEATTQKVTVEIVEKKEEVEPKKVEGNGSQNSGKKKKKKKNANKGANVPKIDENVENVVPNDDFVDDYVFTKDDAEKILESFSKEELAEVLISALKKHGDVAKDVADVAHKDSAKRKLFVRGLAWDTKSETLRSVFSAYGEIERADIVMDKSSGKNKGFGFVTYKSFAGVLAALKEPNKKIDERVTVCHLSTGMPAPDPQQVTARKIYVGGLPKDVDSGKLAKLFSQYGEIEEGPLGFDKVTGKSKGFAFFIYKSEKSAKNALEEPTKTFDGATLTCKAAPRRNNNNNGPALNVTPSRPVQANMWSYGPPMGGYFPMGNYGSPLFQPAFSNRKRH